MSTPDPLHVRGFGFELQRHRDNGRRSLEAAKRHLDSLLASWDGEPSSLLAYDARHLVASAAELWAEVAGLLALHDVRFVVESTETPEA